MFESVRLEKLLVGVVTNASIMQDLGLTWPQLLDLSILQGNDFSSPIIRKNSRLWRETIMIPKSDPESRYPSIKDVASYVRGLREGSLQRSPQFVSFCVNLSSALFQF